MLHESQSPTGIDYVDLVSGSVLEYRDLCYASKPPSAKANSESCDRSVTTRYSYPNTSSEWVHGSSLFQGMTLKQGELFERVFYERGRPIGVEFHVAKVHRTKEGLEARVQASVVREDSPDWRPPEPSEYIVTDASPFVVSAKRWLWTPPRPNVAGHFEPVRSLRLEDARGGGPVVPVPVSGSLPPPTPEPWGRMEPWTGLKFPGAQRFFPHLGGSFGEFLDYSLDHGLAADERGGFAGLSLESPRQEIVNVGPAEIATFTVECDASFMRSDSTSARFVLSKKYHRTPAASWNDSYGHTAGEVVDRAKPMPRSDIALNYTAAVEFVERQFGVSNFTPGITFQPPVSQLREGETQHLAYVFSDPVQQVGGSGGLLAPIIVDAEYGVLEEATIRA